jgi:DNA-binding response OmpR family regulator/predicted negative regulator of RcsB-dependent stress response
MDTSPVHILLIEDDGEFRELLSGFLEDEGYRVTAVASGEAAIEAAHSQTVDLVIADVKLGGIDGLDALSRIKAHQNDLQGLVMTGYSTEADSIRAVKLGVGNYLKKPFTIKDFLQAVEALISRIQEAREARDREMALLQTLAWALQSVLQGVPELDKPAEIARRACNASLFCGLDGVASENIRLAVLAAVVRRHGEPAGIPFVFKGLPRPVAGLLETFESGTSLEEQLVRLGVALIEMREVSVCEQVHEGYQESQARELGSRGLLPLGLALESAGDLDAAERVFARLIHDSARRRDVVQGRLGRARVLFTRGQARESLVELEQIASAERDSVFAAEAHLESGILLARMGKREPALEGLRRALEGFRRTGGSLGGARAQLCLQALGEGEVASSGSNLALMLQPQHLDAFFQSAPWLFSFLLKFCRRSEAPPEALRGVKRYFRDLPGFVDRWIRQARSQDQVMLALEALAELGTAGYESTLATLAQDSRDSVRHLAQKLLSVQKQGPASPALRLYGFGEFDAFVGDRQVVHTAWQGKKSVYVLCYLALRQGDFVSREALVEHFWPDSGERGFKSLSQLLVVIHKALQPPDARKVRYIAREGNSLGLDPEQLVWHDVNEAESCLKRAAKMPGGEGAEQLERAFELYRGPYLDGCYMDWALEARREIERRLVEAGLRLADVRLAQDRAQEAVEVADTVVRIDPLCQQASLRTMEALVRLGRPEEAVRVFERFERLLAAELGMEPNTELVRAFHVAKLAI